jgi:hypothetical protein
MPYAITVGLNLYLLYTYVHCSDRLTAVCMGLELPRGPMYGYLSVKMVKIAGISRKLKVHIAEMLKTSDHSDEFSVFSIRVS